jgi:hypothetical protein
LLPLKKYLLPQVLPGSEEVWGVGEEGGWGPGVEVAQTMYTHMNKCKNNKKFKS